MPIPRIRTTLLLVMLALLTGLFIWGAPQVPFHPDESTQLFMSSDFELLFANPLSMAWNPDQPLDARERYRLLDAPLTRYLLGLGRVLTNQPALPVDWDWTQSWEQNQAAGAVPSADLLKSGRLIVTILLPFSVYFLYRSGSLLGGRITGILAAAILALNALVLLHDRRAMAEGAMTFGITLTLWVILSGKFKPWWIGLAFALAFNAKQSTLALLPLVLLAVLLPPPGERLSIRNLRYLNPAIIFLVFTLATLALNPFLWKHPVQGLQTASRTRLDFVAGQVETLERLAPEQVLETPGERAAVLVAQLYLVPPAVAEAGNYLAATAQASREYFAFPIHNLFRGPMWGMIFFTLTLFGIGSFLYRVIRHKDRSVEAYRLGILLMASLLQFAALVYTIPIPWQRYAMPMVPFACIWSAYGFTPLIRLVQPAWIKERSISGSEIHPELPVK